MDTAPRDGTPILAWCDHKADPYVEDEKTGRLTTYAAHCEGGIGHVIDGPHVVVWGGEYSEDDWESDTHLTIPDWWFLFDDEFQTVANPTRWLPIIDLLNQSLDPL